MNKEQTDCLITLAFGSVIFVLGILSVYLFSIGFYDSFTDNPVFVFIVILGTCLGIGMGGMFVVTSIYGINDARSDKKEDE